VQGTPPLASAADCFKALTALPFGKIHKLITDAFIFISAKSPNSKELKVSHVGLKEKNPALFSRDTRNTRHEGSAGFEVTSKLRGCSGEFIERRQPGHLYFFGFGNQGYM
jgi:hypothetical protein